MTCISFSSNTFLSRHCRTFVFLLFLFSFLFFWFFSPPSANPNSENPLSTESGIEAKPQERMSLKVIEVYHSNKELLEVLENINKEGERKSRTFLLFLGDNLENGRSWCPDCARADPIIMKHFRSLETPTTLVRVFVGDRPTWRNPGNAFRAPPFGVFCVPTLGKWEGSRLAPGALGDSEADQEDLLQTLTKT